MLAWATEEGWNPGKYDAELFWQTDPAGFLGFYQDDELVGSISLVTYGTRYGFAGLFIVKPDSRGHGFGSQGVSALISRFRDRLDADATIAIDGVFDMQAYYASLGMLFQHRNIRMAGLGSYDHESAAKCEDIADVPFDLVVAFDAQHFGAARAEFLRGWLQQPESKAVAIRDNNELVGMGVARVCHQGYKIGPLFAATSSVAETLYGALSDFAAGQPLFIDIPECNPEAQKLAARHQLQEVFGCARMYMGPPPAISWPGVYGVTTFELG